MYLLGYDIGSSSIKAALVEVSSHDTIGVASYPETEMDMISRQSGWAEQQPEVWWQDFCFVTRKLLLKTNVNPNDIKGIGISYQMHGLVLINESQQVLRPSIIWCDSRAVSIGDKAFKEIGKEWCLENCLNSPGNFTASKLKWVKDNEPETYFNAHKFLLPGDFITMKLTGQVSTTIPGLSEGIFWDFNKRKVSQEILDYYELNEDLIPDVVPTFSHQGEVTKEAAELTGLVPGIPITYRAGDQPNNALSLNVLQPGEIAATCGTSGVVYGIVDKPLYDPKSRVNGFAHVNYEDNFDRIGILLCINGAGMQYSWMKHQIARSGREYEDMERMASSIPIGSDGLCLLPFGNGAERILENKNLNSHFHNLQFNRHNRAHLFRAALEGVAFSFVYGVNILKEMGLDVNVMRVGNDNMFQSDVFAMTIATLLDCHIEVVETTGAVGAAKAAGVKAGQYKDLDEALRGIKPIQIHEPRLNQALCLQAYNYWSSNLEKALTDKYTRPLDRIDDYEDELDSKTRQLASTQLKLISKGEFLKEVYKDLNDIADNDKSNKIKKVLDKIEKQFNSNKEWEEFEEQFNLLNSDFFKQLKAKVPEISNDEARLCALIKMNLSTKEIAAKLNLSIRGIETKRYRLRKKLPIDNSDSIESFLETLQ
ncbi:MAG: FGGY family carbohydrate kinase [bacterium]|nr:FGGY family carbohydrate kinase [bacterium]